VATFPGFPDQATVFAYERGAEMKSLVAPARRVGFFVRDTGAVSLTQEDWALFDAAVRWCAGK